MSRRRRTGMLLNPEVAGALLVDRMEEAFDRFGQEMPASAFDPAVLADAIGDLTRRKPFIMRLIFEHPDVRAAYTRAIAEQTAGEARILRP